MALADTEIESLETELQEINVSFENSSAVDILAWAGGRFGDKLIITSSFQDCVLIDLAVKALDKARIVFLDTGFHFPETIAYMHRIEKLYDIKVEVVDSGLPDDVSPCGSPDCCHKRKVLPLLKVLETGEGWVTGIKRSDTKERESSPIISYDAAKKVVKINQIATWSDQDVQNYEDNWNLPRHPLTFVGYRSIGCAPTTRPTEEWESPRDGRWPGMGKTECGLHI